MKDLMAVDTQDEILQDFLMEAGEILEHLNGQLLDLEQQPDDQELLNAVFRGFHTIKGGAGFLAITPLVEICHRAEDVFNVLRTGQRRVDVRLMDSMLRVLDTLNEMFDRVRAGRDPEQADPQLLETLRQLTEAEPEVGSGAAPADQSSRLPTSERITAPEKEEETAESDQISEQEFEALLDQLHGAGRHGGVPFAEVAARETVSPNQPMPNPESTEASRPSDNPQLSGKGVRGTGGAAAHAGATVRVDTARLDRIMNMVGELVLVRNRLANLKSRLNDEEVASAVANLDLVTADLQSSVMKTRMQPIKKVFGRFPRVVRDLARSMHKEISLEMYGEDTDLDKNLVEALADPMVHLVRNAVDHGIETPAERRGAGKPEQGRVVLSAAQEGDHILLNISDDGRGMDAEVLRRKAVEKGLMEPELAARLEARDCFDLIFQPGFSTRTELSDVSGRGVGMDVVKTRITQMNGSVEIDSEPGSGTTITIKLPLTLAILPTLMVVLGSQSFALPLSSVVEIFNLDLTRTNRVDGQLTIMVREHALPLFYLRKWLVTGSPRNSADGGGHVVVVNVGGKQVCLVVDALIGQEEVVIKPLGSMLQGLDGMAGATITGDGKIALILDVPGLVRKYVHRCR